MMTILAATTTTRNSHLLIWTIRNELGGSRSFEFEWIPTFSSGRSSEPTPELREIDRVLPGEVVDDVLATAVLGADKLATEAS